MRKIADCRLFPSESRCSLTISGTEEEVVRAASEHAASVHGHANTSSLQQEVRAMLADESPAGRYGTVMIATLTGSLDQVRGAAVDWAAHRAAAGFIAEEVLLADDGRTVVAPVFFASKQDYERLAADPGQDTWWQEQMAPHLSDVRWIDGTWQESVSHVPAMTG